MDLQSPGSHAHDDQDLPRAASRPLTVPQPSPFAQRLEEEDVDERYLSSTFKRGMQMLSSSIGGLGRTKSTADGRRRRSIGSTGESTVDEEEEESMQGAANRHAEAGTAIRSQLLKRAMQKDLDALNVYEFDQHQVQKRQKMSRFQLLAECREGGEQGGEQLMGSSLQVSVDACGVRCPALTVPGGACAGVGSCETSESYKACEGQQCLCDEGRWFPALVLRVCHAMRGADVGLCGCQVVSLEPLHAVITREKGFVVIPEQYQREISRGARDTSRGGPQQDPEELMRRFLTRVQQPESYQGGLPFELIAVEALMVTAVHHKRAQVDECVLDAKKVLRSIRKSMSVLLLNKILTVKKNIDELYQAVRGAQQAIEEVQEDDDAMILMFLTAIHKDPSLAEKMQAQNEKQSNRLHLMEVEVLLDAYALEYEGLANELSSLHKEIDATEDLLKFKLDKARNRLIRIDVGFGMIGTWLGACTAVAGFFGMNVPYGAYTDGTVKPGEKFIPPTSGTSYDGPWEGGPSWDFFEVGITSVGGTLSLIVITLVFYCLFGLSRVWAVRRRLKKRERYLQGIEGTRG